jgi:hypothetical protein
MRELGVLLMDHIGEASLMAVRRTKRPLIYVVGWLAITANWLVPTKAHDIYTTLTDINGESCCHERDCRPAHHRKTAAGVEMLVDGEWIVVPEDTVQYRNLVGDTGETAGGHWCGRGRGELKSIVTFCAVLPPSSSLFNGESLSPTATEVAERTLSILPARR